MSSSRQKHSVHDKGSIEDSGKQILVVGVTKCCSCDTQRKLRQNRKVSILYFWLPSPSLVAVPPAGRDLLKPAHKQKCGE